MTSARSPRRLNGWLLRALQDAGRIRSARLTVCGRCGAQTLTGLDGDIAAIEVCCDPWPVTPLGEALALATRRYTFMITVRDRRAYLDRRDRWQIRGKPAGTVDVLAEHACHQPLPEAPSVRVHYETHIPDRPPF